MKKLRRYKERLAVCEALVLIIVWVALNLTAYAEEPPPPWGRDIRNASGGKRKTTKMIDKVDDNENFTNRTGGPVNDLHVTYSDDGRKAINWVGEPNAGTSSQGNGWRVDGVESSSDRGTDSITVKLSSDTDLEAGGSVNLWFKARLNDKNYVRKKWKWTKDGDDPPGPGAPQQNGGPQDGGSKPDVGKDKNRRANGDRRVRYLHVVNPAAERLIAKNLKLQITSSVVSGSDLLDPGFWSGLGASPDIIIEPNDYSSPIPVYGLAPDKSETIAFKYDRYWNNQYTDTVYMSMKPNGAGWDFVTGIDVKNSTATSQVSLSYSVYDADVNYSNAGAGSDDFSSNSAVLNGAHQIDVSYSGGNIPEGNWCSVWSSGTMDKNGAAYVQDLKWGDNSVAAKDYCHYIYGDFADELYDVSFTYRSLYGETILLKGLEYVLTDTFLGADQVESWASGWISLGSGTEVIEPGDTVSFAVEGVRPYQSLSFGGRVYQSSSSGAGTLSDEEELVEEFDFSHQDIARIYVEWTFNPQPSDGSTGIDADAVLTWTPGISAVSHDVYLGTDWDDVNDATTLSQEYKGNYEPNEYGPGLLEWGTTYYWRVDAVNEPNVWKGEVWSLRTRSAIVDPNLIVWYKLDESWPQDTAYDYSGHEFHGFVDGPEHGWEPNEGRLNGCRILDGDTALVVPKDALSSVNSAISIALWLKGKDGQSSDTDMVICDGGDANLSGAHRMTILVPSDEGDVVWRAGNDTNDVLLWDLEGADASCLEGFWHHVAFVKDENAGLMSIYFDGLPVVSTTDVNVDSLVNVANKRFKIGSYNFQDRGYQGRLDDFRVYDRALSMEEIASLSRGGDLASAWAPSPYDGQGDVPHNANLAWRPGDYADHHDVYLGTDWDDVNDATTTSAGIYRGRQDPCEYDPPGDLELDTTYYWRIDEVNDPCLWKGAVWQFTVSNYIIIDDFESYDNTDNLIRDTWWDGGGLILNGAYIELGKEPDAPVHGGTQSMMYWYDNTIKWDFFSYHSMAERPFDSPTDLTYGGQTKVLALYFYGDPGNDANDTEQLYVALTGSYAKLRYSSDAGNDNNDLRLEEWTEWNIPLSEFISPDDVDETAVTSLVIGFGDSDNTTMVGGDGIVYFDDIRLYPPRCVPSLIKPYADLSNNCIVDWADVEIMAEDWLETEQAEQSLANLYNGEPPEQQTINFRDFAVLADGWLEEKLWP